MLAGIRVGTAAGGTSNQHVNFYLCSSLQSSHPPAVSGDPQF